MKKKRGLRKYYRNLEKSFDKSILTVTGENAWFDFYHFHIDNTGLGNKSWNSRKQHLDALFLIAEKVESLMREYDKPFQFWIEVYDHESWDDAIYIHSENPNQSNFPTSLVFDKDVDVTNTKLKDYLINKDYIVKTKNLLEEDKPIVGYFLQKKNLGITLEK